MWGDPLSPLPPALLPLKGTEVVINLFLLQAPASNGGLLLCPSLAEQPSRVSKEKAEEAGEGGGGDWPAHALHQSAC